MEESRQDRLHRTAKLEIDEGRAGTIEEAEKIAASYILQVDVGTDIAENTTRQAALLTVINTGARAFLGGVRARIADDPILSVPWARGMRLSEAVNRFGGVVVRELSGEHPTIRLGRDYPNELHEVPQPLLYPTWEGWSGGVVDAATDRLGEGNGFPLAGVLAGALAVSEAFQSIRGYPVAGRRTLGLSLWRLESDWREEALRRLACRGLPAKLWLVGLGHLGQAYSWTLGFLPYRNPGQVRVLLQDFDEVHSANVSTSLLVNSRDLGRRKARVVAQRLEEIGFRTDIVERRFDADTRRRAEEPGVVLGGLDDPVPRRALGSANFDLILDAGLGAGVGEYLDILCRFFPSSETPEEAWPSRATEQRDPNDLMEKPAYEALSRELVSDGASEDEARCGVIDVAGQAVGAAFVGTVAACLVIAEALRTLCGGPRYEIISLSLRSPEHRDVVPNSSPGGPVNPGYLAAAD